MDDLQKILKAPIFANDVGVRAKIVVRRTEMTPHDVDMGCRRGMLNPGGRSVCELVVNGSVIATGTITEHDGMHFFEKE